MFNPAFSLQTVNSYREVFLDSIIQHLKILEKKAKTGEPLDAFEFTKSISSMSILRALFGVPMSLEDEKDLQDMRDLENITHKTGILYQQFEPIVKVVSLFPPIKYLFFAMMALTTKKEDAQLTNALGQKMLYIFKRKEQELIATKATNGKITKEAELFKDDQQHFDSTTEKGSSL